MKQKKMENKASFIPLLLQQSFSILTSFICILILWIMVHQDRNCNKHMSLPVSTYIPVYVHVYVQNMTYKTSFLRHSAA